MKGDGKNYRQVQVQVITVESLNRTPGDKQFFILFSEIENAHVH